VEARVETPAEFADYRDPSARRKTGGRASGRTVVPQCPFVKAWIGKHPE